MYMDTATTTQQAHDNYFAANAAYVAQVRETDPTFTLRLPVKFATNSARMYLAAAWGIKVSAARLRRLLAECATVAASKELRVAAYGPGFAGGAGTVSMGSYRLYSRESVDAMAEAGKFA